MNTLVDEIELAHTVNGKVTEDFLTVDLDDGRTIIVPLGWYPRLWFGTPDERSSVEIIGQREYSTGPTWMRI